MPDGGLRPVNQHVITGCTGLGDWVICVNDDGCPDRQRGCGDLVRRLQLASEPKSEGGVAGARALGAWARRDQLRLVDALYVELAVTQGLPLVTTDGRLREVPAADVVTA